MPVVGADIATYALKKAGVTAVGLAPSASNMQDALADLNDMLAQWRIKRWMVWNLVQLSKTSTGALSYSIGPAGDFACDPRPNRIDAAFVRQFTAGGLPVDTPLEVLAAREDYNRLALKTMVSFPRYVFMDSGYPLGTVYTYPVMTSAIYALHLSVKDTLPTITVNTDLSVLPPEYIPAMKFNLAKRQRQAFGKGKTPDVELNIMASDALDVIKDANLQIPELVMPSTITRPGRYNILSDQTY